MANDGNVDQMDVEQPAASEGQETNTDDRRARREQLVQERRRARAEMQERQKRKRLVTLATLGVATLAVLVVFGLLGANWWSARQSNDQQQRETLAALIAYNYEAGAHQEGELSYAESPPVGGPHSDVWQRCGYYAGSIPSWNAVHSLEHGAVWIDYSPDLPQDQIDDLRNRAETQGYTRVSPFPRLTSPIVASSWNHQLALTSADDLGLNAFIEKYRVEQEFTSEYGATCSGGSNGTLAA